MRIKNIKFLWVAVAVVILNFSALLMLAAPASAQALAHSKKRPATIPVASRVLQPELRMGAVALHPCGYNPQFYCGSLPRALDPTGQVAGTIHIHFEVDLHTDKSQPPLETLVAEEGGPGFGSTMSGGGYRTMFGPLLARHDLVLMDQRGTGYSQAIDCPVLQNELDITQYGVIQCGAQLGTQSDLYGTGLATDDLAAILDALGVGKIDLYGDSYEHFSARRFRRGIHSVCVR